MKNIIKNLLSTIYRNKWFVVKTLILLLMLWFVASLEYKTIVMMMLTFVWRKRIMRWCIFSRKKWGRMVARHSWKVMMALLAAQLWISLPRFRTGSDDRLQLYYLNDQGERVSTPVSHWLFNVLVPEEEIMNLGVWSARFGGGIAERLGIGGTMMEQFRDDEAQGKIDNFYAPYRNLDIKSLSLVSATTSQAFNDLSIGSKTKAVYVLRPTNYDKEKYYPVVFFCHGYLGNWKLYQGLFTGMDDCLVVSCGTKGLSGIFSHDDISGLLNDIIPMLEREGYKINQGAVHLIGLSNGGTAGEVAQSSFPNRFKSITYISTGIHNTGKTKCTINLIGGGKDPSSSTMYPAYRTLKKNGTKANILWYDDESHFVLVNKVSEIMSFILHDAGLSRTDASYSRFNNIEIILISAALGNLILVSYPCFLVSLSLYPGVYILLLLLGISVIYYGGIGILNALLLLVLSRTPKGEKRIRVLRWMCKIQRLLHFNPLKRFSKWFFRIFFKKGIRIWRWYLRRYWLPIMLLWFASISIGTYYQNINYDSTEWDGFKFHDERDIGKCFDIKGFPKCHVISKHYQEGDYDYCGTCETVTFDTDDYARFIKKLSDKVDKDSLWDSYSDGVIYYSPDSAHTPKGLDCFRFSFDEGNRRFTIMYN